MDNFKEKVGWELDRPDKVPTSIRQNTINKAFEGFRNGDSSDFETDDTDIFVYKATEKRTLGAVIIIKSTSEYIYSWKSETAYIENAILYLKGEA